MVDNGDRNQKNMQRKFALTRVALIRAAIRYCRSCPKDTLSNCKLVIRSCRTDAKKGKSFEGEQFVDPTKRSLPFGARGTRVLCSPYFCYDCHLTMASRRSSRSVGIYRSLLTLSWGIQWTLRTPKTAVSKRQAKISSMNMMN